ncbi:hypothetical protein [Streptomyces griseus]|uniref:hypothetical protein n=1 Tax=Streptomyces griseus TaxID=1911 RepID=UPI000AC3742D|nr:hypothetical protein [Streptomyces griseus]
MGFGDFVDTRCNGGLPPSTGPLRGSSRSRRDRPSALVPADGRRRPPLVDRHAYAPDVADLIEGCHALGVAHFV